MDVYGRMLRSSIPRTFAGMYLKHLDDMFGTYRFSDSWDARKGIMRYFESKPDSYWEAVVSFCRNRSIPLETRTISKLLLKAFDRHLRPRRFMQGGLLDLLSNQEKLTWTLHEDEIQKIIVRSSSKAGSGAVVSASSPTDSFPATEEASAPLAVSQAEDTSAKAGPHRYCLPSDPRFWEDWDHD